MCRDSTMQLTARSKRFPQIYERLKISLMSTYGRLVGKQKKNDARPNQYFSSQKLCQIFPCALTLFEDILNLPFSLLYLLVSSHPLTSFLCPLFPGSWTFPFLLCNFLTFKMISFCSPKERRAIGG